jgi:hypothetical protein
LRRKLLFGIGLACLLPALGAATALSTSGPARARVVTAVAVPSQLGRYGGKVKVAGKVQDATTCQLRLLSSQPLPVVYSGSSRPCSSSFTAKVVIGPNPSSASRVVTFALVARNSTSSFSEHFSVDLAGPSTTTTTTTAPSAASTVPALSTTPASQWQTSLFDSNVQTWSVDASSALYVSDFVADYQTDYGSVGVDTLPVYIVPQGQPRVAVSVAAGCNNFLPNTGAKIPVPAAVELNGSSDNPLVIWQPSTNSDWELWKVAPLSATSYTACWGGKLDTATSNGVFQYPYGLSATGISYLATAITEADVASGSIDHAIAITLPRCDSSVYPADRTDCGDDAGQPGEGQWFRFAPGTQMPSGLTPFAQMVFRAIETYGAVVTDQARGVFLEAEQPSDWAAEGHTGTDPITASWEGLQAYQVVASLPWSDLQVVDPPSS